MRKNKYLLIINRKNEQHVFIFRAKDNTDAMTIADEEYKKWVNADYYEMYNMTKEIYGKELNLILPSMCYYSKKVLANEKDN